MKWFKIYIKQITCLTYIYVQAKSAEEAIKKSQVSRNVRGTFSAVELTNGGEDLENENI